MTVVNKKTHKPTSNDVYIGRPSIWGNPYVIGHRGDRNAVVARYRTYMRSKVLKYPHMMKLLLELKGKNLVCYCAPQACHGDVLEALIEEMTT